MAAPTPDGKKSAAKKNAPPTHVGGAFSFELNASPAYLQQAGPQQAVQSGQAQPSAQHGLSQQAVEQQPSEQPAAAGVAIVGAGAAAEMAIEARTAVIHLNIKTPERPTPAEGRAGENCR